MMAIESRNWDGEKGLDRGDYVADKKKECTSAAENGRGKRRRRKGYE